VTVMVGETADKEWMVNNNSLVCQPRSDFSWRAIPLVGDKYFVDELGAKVNASA
jgi:hypothetical protein